MCFQHVRRDGVDNRSIGPRKKFFRAVQKSRRQRGLDSLARHSATHRDTSTAFVMHRESVYADQRWWSKGKSRRSEARLFCVSSNNTHLNLFIEPSQATHGLVRVVVRVGTRD